MIARFDEQVVLRRAANSDESEFVAVYGRRRVGKTYLVRETFDGEFTFTHAGVARAGMARQLQAFRSALKESGHEQCPRLTNWLDAFDELKVVVKAQPSARKKILFIDEMPWMDTPKSGFVPALEHFWNSWASARKDILLIVCGSATSWIINKVIRDKGGLHGRVTEQILVAPFTLKECEEYAKSRGIEWTRRQIAEMYMVFGGVPYYWRHLLRGMSPAQNIDQLFFAENGSLRGEFEELYGSLFRRKEPYVDIVTALGRRKAGMSRDELVEMTSIANGGRLSTYLEELEQCGFIRRFDAVGKRSKDAVYQLVDCFTLFHFRFAAENVRKEPDFWSRSLGTPVHDVWAGLAFERLCLLHRRQLKEALRIGGVSANICSWRGKDAQIDLIIDRNDGIIDICEMKYSGGPYALDAEEWGKIARRRSALREAVGMRKAIHVVMVTAYGLVSNAWANEVKFQLTLDDLFR